MVNMGNSQVNISYIAPYGIPHFNYEVNSYQALVQPVLDASPLFFEFINASIPKSLAVRSVIMHSIESPLTMRHKLVFHMKKEARRWYVI